MQNLKDTSMAFRRTSVGLIAVGAAFVLGLYGCGGGGGGTAPASVTSNAYQGAGSAWSLASNSDGTCTLSESVSNLKVNAACTKLTSGFTKLTVTSATGGSVSLAAPAAGTVTYAYEVDGYMMPFIAFTENKVVPTVSAGTCSSSLNHNFVVSYAKLGLNTDFTGWATMGNYTLTNGTLSLNRYKADGTFLSNPNFPMSTSGCSNGVLETTTSGDLTRFYFTQNGGAIFYRDSSNSTPVTNGGSTEDNFMLPTTNDVTSLAGMDGNYIGFVTTSQGNGNFTTTPVSVIAANGAFSLSARSGTDLATSTANHSSFTLGATKVAASLYKGSLTHTKAGGSIGCAINANISNQKIVICSGLDPADATNKTLYSAILKSI
jgi:hypothetical protein